ncbi:hypothetical protein CEUSTIGMA_g776.t1 [Chlamydomonas eustigma]|uniref:Uncharacterized protein n=1 Tax=Chlamydomonas eustigma TaxID=1157962 RepID=A0A250WRM6_9CHLO|nr:hypothetical protein CEUSTIGMA_g776.t1 [Chlamydomonas eustigma]|eukprot:GAX73322.1 hypothetical protein CEUSTIGMA_g776.t1 [Chlamydomonas eustigma]
MASALAAYGVCQSGCNAAWVFCCSAAGVVAGTVTAGAGVPAAVAACSATQGACMSTCAGLSLAVGAGGIAAGAAAVGAGATAASAVAASVVGGVLLTAAAPIAMIALAGGGLLAFFSRLLPFIDNLI